MKYTEALRASFEEGMGCRAQNDRDDIVHFLVKDGRGKLVIRSCSPKSRGVDLWRDSGAPCDLETLEGEFFLCPLPWAKHTIGGTSLADIFPEALS